MLAMLIGRAYTQCDPHLSVEARDQSFHYGTNDLINSIPIFPSPIPAFVSNGIGLIEAYRSGCIDVQWWGFSLTFPDAEFNWRQVIRRAASAGFNFGRDGVTINGVRQLLSPTITSCEPILLAQLDYITGSADLYTFHVGTGPFPRKIRKAHFTTCRDLVIENNSQQVLEIPVHISGSVLAAESFGDNDRTYGKAQLRMWGSVDGQSFSEGTPLIESQSVIPVEASVNVTRRFVVAPGPGAYTIRIAIQAEAYAEVQAKSTGLFGFLSGAATAVVLFPETIRIGYITGPNGSPLPRGVRIFDPDSSSFFADTRDEGDVNGDGCVDDADLLLLLFAFGQTGSNLSEDLNHDGIVDDADLLTVLFNFGSGC